MQRFVSMPNTYAWKRFYGDSDPSCQELMLCMKCLLVRTMLRVEHVYMEWLSRVEHMLCMERLCGDCHAWNTCYAWNVFVEPVTCWTHVMHGTSVWRLSRMEHMLCMKYLCGACRTHVMHGTPVWRLSRVEHMHELSMRSLSRFMRSLSRVEHMHGTSVWRLSRVGHMHDMSMWSLSRVKHIYVVMAVTCRTHIMYGTSVRRLSRIECMLCMKCLCGACHV